MDDDIRRLRDAAVFEAADREQTASVPWPAPRRVAGTLEEVQEPTEQEFVELFDHLWRPRAVVHGTAQVADPVQESPEERERHRARLLRLQELPDGWGFCQCTNCEQIVSPSDGTTCDFCFDTAEDCGCDCKGCTGLNATSSTASHGGSQEHDVQGHPVAEHEQREGSAAVL